MCSRNFCFAGLALYLGLLISSAHAQKDSRFYLSAAAKGGMSSIESGDGKAVESRSMYAYGAEATLGYVFSGVLYGASAEYMIHDQREDADETGGTNASGKQLTVSPVVGFPLGNFLFLAKPQFFSTYTLNQKSASDETVKYSSPELPSFTAQLLYSLGRSFIGIEYTRMTYKKREQGGNEDSLDSDEKLIIGTMGLVYGYKF